MPINVCSSVRCVGCSDLVATEVFHFIVGGSVSRAGHIRRRRRAELTRRTDYEWEALAPVRAQCERNQTDWILPPMSRLIARKIIDANARLGDLRTIVETHRENRCSRPLSQIDPV
jgi:hypothetical protein